MTTKFSPKSKTLHISSDLQLLLMLRRSPLQFSLFYRGLFRMSLQNSLLDSAPALHLPRFCSISSFPSITPGVVAVTDLYSPRFPWLYFWFSPLSQYFLLRARRWSQCRRRCSTIGWIVRRDTLIKWWIILSIPCVERWTKQSWRDDGVTHTRKS